MTHKNLFKKWLNLSKIRELWCSNLPCPYLLSMRLSWSFDEVDERLHGIMKEIFKACYDASVECGQPGNLMLGANVAGFLKVAEAMMAQGIV